jgi:hypothetical protein
VLKHHHWHHPIVGIGWPCDRLQATGVTDCRQPVTRFQRGTQLFAGSRRYPRRVSDGTRGYWGRVPESWHTVRGYRHDSQHQDKQRCDDGAGVGGFGVLVGGRGPNPILPTHLPYPPVTLPSPPTLPTSPPYPTTPPTTRLPAHPSHRPLHRLQPQSVASHRLQPQSVACRLATAPSSHQSAARKPTITAPRHHPTTLPLLTSPPLPTLDSMSHTTPVPLPYPMLLPPPKFRIATTISGAEKIPGKFPGETP